MHEIRKRLMEIVKILLKKQKGLFIITFLAPIIASGSTIASIWLNSEIFNMGLLVAAKEVGFLTYLPYMGFFLLFSLLQLFLGSLLTQSYLYPKCQLMFRTVYKEQLIEKLEKVKYECFEKTETLEIIDKVLKRIEGELLFLFPILPQQMLSCGIVSIGLLGLIASIKWWLVPLLLVPFLFETWLLKRMNLDIYREMEQYWKKDEAYLRLGKMLHTRHYIRENYMLAASDYLIKTYQERLHTRNREYETFYLRHLRRNLIKRSLTRLSQVAAAVMLLLLYISGELSIGLLVSVTLAIFSVLFSNQGLEGLLQVVRTSGLHMKNYELLDAFWKLPEEQMGEAALPERFDIVFDRVTFTYPGEKEPVLKEVSFHIKQGERVALVGRNGSGKTTLVKLLLGLFQPESGRILIDGRNLSEYSQKTRSRMFGAVFQDFTKYEISLRENIAVGAIEKLENDPALQEALKKAKMDTLVKELPDGFGTRLGKELEDGVDLSGGQWQRIALARAFLGDKKILVLDEPTSQIDPLEESQLYTEFAEIAKQKTALFITHRLGAIKITDRILVLKRGCIVEAGTHEELLREHGEYAQLYQAQKQWYQKKKG